MTLRGTPTIAICLGAGLAFGIALARPASNPAPQPAPAAAEAAADDVAAGDPDSPYLVDGEDPANQPAGDQPADAAPAPAAETAAVTIEGFAFSGATDLAPGTTVSVENLDGAPHTLTSDDGLFDTGNLNQGDSADIVVPSEPGTYTYFCAIHPSMTGTFNVG